MFSRTSTLLLILGLGTAPFTLADTFQVPGDFSTIQAAIDAAADGDTIEVAAGTYSGPVDLLGKQITLRGVAGAAATVIDAAGAEGWLVRTTSGETTDTRIEGFTITGAFGDRGDAHVPTGGGWLNSGAPQLFDIVITDNIGRTGAGFYNDGGSPRLEQVTISNNSGSSGAGLYSAGGAITATRLDLIGNASGQGAGAFLSGGDHVLTHLDVRENRGHGLGGALYVNHAQIDLRWSTFEDNGVATINDNSTTFQTLGGGAIYTTNATGLIANSTFQNNAGAFGGALYLRDSGNDLVVANVLIENNNGGVGGAIYFNASSPTIVNTTATSADSICFFTTFNANPRVLNSIVEAGNTFSVAAAVFGGNGNFDVRYSIVNGPTGIDVNLGPGVLFTDPLLGADAVPTPGSPAIDAGDNSVIPPDVMLDLAGNMRRADDPDTTDTGLGTPPIVDIGAFEFQATGPSMPPMNSRPTPTSLGAASAVRAAGR